MGDDNTYQEALKRYEEIVGEPCDRPVEKHPDGWHFGERVRVLEDDENRGTYEGDTGMLVVSEVGAPEYNNVSIHLSLLIDGYDSEVDVDPLNIEVE